MLPVDEQRKSLSAICRHPLLQRDGRPIHISSAHRWINHGVRVYQQGAWRRIRLEHERGPRGIVSSDEAVVRFIRNINTVDALHPEPYAAHGSRRKAENDSKSLASITLDAMGI